MKCPQCGYLNKPDAISCNLCQAVLKKERNTTRVAAPAARKQHLLVRAGAPSIELEPGKLFTIGRQTSCTLAVPSSRVSRLHAEISWNAGEPLLADKGSSNGTFVGGKRIDAPHRLTTGDEVEIGPFHCVYRFGDPEAVLPGTGDDAMEGTVMMKAGGDFLSGQIAGGGLVELLQSLEFNRKTGTLEVHSPDARGWMTVSEGVPFAAEISAEPKQAGAASRGGQPPLLDEEAVQRVLSAASGRFVFLPQLKTPERRMKLTMTALLLEAGRRADERGLHQTSTD